MPESMIVGLNHPSAVIMAGLLNSAAVTVAAIALAMMLARSKRFSASTRYGLWWLTLLFVLAAPFLSISIPQHRIEQAPTPGKVFSSAALPHPVKPMALQRTSLSYASIALLAWMLAATVQMLRILVSLSYSLRLKRVATPFVCDLGGVRMCRAVEIRTTNEVPSAAVVGYLRPQVLLPVELAESLSTDELRQVMMHELAHVERYDDWAIAAQRVIEAILVAHPLVRYLGHRLNHDREAACDDMVSASHEPRIYAACLAKIAQASSSLRAQPVLVPLLEGKSELLSRVESLLDRTRAHSPRVSIRQLALAGTMLLLVGAVGLQAPRLMALPAQATSSSDIRTITVTSADGDKSRLGNWDSDSHETSEPGTIQFRMNKKLYVIRDSATVNKAEQAFQPMEELGRKQEALGKKQSKLGEQQARLGELQEKITDRQLDSAALAKLNSQLKGLAARLAELESQRAPKTASEAQEHLADLQAKLADMQAAMAVEQSKAGDEQGRLGEQQGTLGEQQGELGRLQGELGERQGAEAKRVAEKLQQLIREAVAHGLAKEK